MNFQINITKDILRRSMMCGTSGFKGSISKNCAIALAVRDLFPNADVGASLINFENGFAHLPYKATQMISEFDRLWKSPKKRLKMDELSFIIDVPEECLPTMDISEIQKILKDSTSLQLVDHE